MTNRLARSAMLSASVLMILAYFGAVRITEHYLATGAKAYIIAAIIWLTLTIIVRGSRRDDSSTT